MQLELELQPTRGVVLRIASSPEAAWQDGIADWFARAAPRAWTTDRPPVVAVPTRSHAQALKARLLNAGHSALGIQFVTPPYLRELLRPGDANAVPPREHLRLLLAVAAEEHLAQTPPEAEQLAAISVQRTADHLLRLLDQLGAAGWEFNSVGLAAFEPIVRWLHAHVAACDFDMPAAVDRAALAHAQQQPPRFSQLLISGFHGAHWPAWHLLRAAVAASQETTVMLQYPREETLDAVWIGSWEEAYGEARPAVADEGAASEREHLFLAGMNAQEQAEAITAAAFHFTADERWSRVAIVFPGAGALSRLVVSLLTRHGISHYDAMGQLLPGIFESVAFTSWLELQRTPRLAVLLRFLHALENDHALFADVSRDRVEKTLRKMLGDLAIDDLAVLRAHCATVKNDAAMATEALLGQIDFLPERATLSEFLRGTSAAFEKLDWPERWREIENRAAWARSLRPAFSRPLFLRWLGEIASTLRITRDAAGSHPYARVQILTPAQAENQTWSHLIFAGLNEGAWPSPAAGDFLPAEQIDAFNASVQKLNRAATRQGRQGEGHIAVREGKALFLGAAQRRQLALARFTSLLDSAEIGVALAASVVQEAAPERVANPSEFFSRVYHQQRGLAVTQRTLRSLREQTRTWLSGSGLLRSREISLTPDVAQTRTAYDARRDAAPSGEYDFALRTPMRISEPMSVSDVEALLKSPALVWMKRFLGVAGIEDATYAWNATVGKWTHDWLASSVVAGVVDPGGPRRGRALDQPGSPTPATTGFAPLPNGAQLEQRIRSAAEETRAEVLRLCRDAHRPLPDWWQSGWENALCVAQALGGILATAEGWPWAAPEWALEAQSIAITPERTLLIRGRADLVLARTEIKPPSLAVPELWIIDFKTGNKKSLAPTQRQTEDERRARVVRRVLKREALQLGLYAMAARESGADDVRVSLISPVVRRAKPQLSADDFADCAPAFAELARMRHEGVFGMHGSLRGAFTFTASYPLATLAIDRDVLAERWERTHPDLVIDEEVPWW